MYANTCHIVCTCLCASFCHTGALGLKGASIGCEQLLNHLVIPAALCLAEAVYAAPLQVADRHAAVGKGAGLLSLAGSVLVSSAVPQG